MTQLLHILRKDCERLWPAILILLASIALHFWQVTHIPPGTGIALNGNIWGLLLFLAELSLVLLPVALIVFLVLAIQEESLVDEHAFWLTRPYSRRVLIAEKLLLVVAVVFLPMLIHDLLTAGWFGLVSSRLVSVILMKDLLLAVVLACFAALAAITSSFGRFTLLGISVLVASGFLALALAHVRKDDWSALSAIPNYFALALASLGSAIAVVYQYRTRRTRLAAAISLTSFLAALLFAVLVSKSAVWHLVERYENSPDTFVHLRLLPSFPSRELVVYGDDKDPDLTAVYPFEATGLPDDTSLELIHARSIFVAPSVTRQLSDSSWRLFSKRPAPWGSSAPRGGTKNFVTLGHLSSAELNRFRSARGILTGTLYSVAYRDLPPLKFALSRRSIPFDIGEAHCTIFNFEQSEGRILTAVLSCQELEPPSGVQVEASIVESSGALIPQVRTSRTYNNTGDPYTLPALLSPVHQWSVQFSFERYATDNRPYFPTGSKIKVEVRTPLGLLHRDFRTGDVSLGKLDAASWMEIATDAISPAQTAH